VISHARVLYIPLSADVSHQMSMIHDAVPHATFDSPHSDIDIASHGKTSLKSSRILIFTNTRPIDRDFKDSSTSKSTEGSLKNGEFAPWKIRTENWKIMRIPMIKSLSAHLMPSMGSSELHKL
jgi:hypothetical protein